MVLINEWLPNPVGKDSGSEFVEIFNSGKGAVNVAGWYLKTKSKSKFLLSGNLGSGEFLVLKKPNFKLALDNTDGEIFIYDQAGKLVDHEQFLGSAPEGKSYNRLASGQFTFSEPTPGALNKFLEQASLVNNSYPYGVPLNQPLGALDLVWLALGVAAVLTGLIIFVIKSNENLSKLFFGGDEVTWR